MTLIYKEGTKLHAIPNVCEIRTSGTCLSIVSNTWDEPRVISRDAEFVIKEDNSDNSRTLRMGDGKQDGRTGHLYQE